MAAQAQPQQQNQRREQIDFPPNTTVTVTMKFAQPKLVSGQFGDRYLFTTCDNRVFFLDPEVAGQIEALGINVREPFTITKSTDGKKGSPVTWQVARLTAPAQPAPQPQSVTPGPQPDGTYAIPRDPDAPPAAKPMARAETASGNLVAEANELVDAYAEVLMRALDKHQGRVKPDEVRALLISTYIKQSRGAA